MKIKTALLWATKTLNKTNSPELDAEILLAFVLKKNKKWLFLYPQKNLTKIQEAKFKKLASQRAKFFPIAYLTSEKEFYGFNFKITPNVLVPRPLTEGLIDQALDFIKNNKKRPLTMADIGTGSGCLIIALAKKLAETENLKNFKFYATDISAKTLAVAKKNAKLHGLSKNIKFYQGDLLKPLLNSAKGGSASGRKKIDLILTNLPYLTKNHVKKEKSIQKEPKTALVGNLYKKLFSSAQKLKTPVTIIYEDLKGIHQKNFNQRQTK